MSLGSRLGRMFDNLARTTASVGKIGGKATGTVAKAGLKTASKVGNKVMDGVEAAVHADKGKLLNNIKDGTKRVGRSVTENVLTDDASYHRIGKIGGIVDDHITNEALRNGIKKVTNTIEGAGVSSKFNLLDEVATHTRAAGNLGYNVATGFNVPFTKGKLKTPALLKASEDSLIGVRATGLGTTLAIGGAAISGVPRAAQTYATERQGMSDGMSVGNAPQMSSMGPYMPAYQQNAGATGDLVFALNDMRRG